MTPAALTRLRALCDAATGGQWQRSGVREMLGNESCIVVRTADGGGMIYLPIGSQQGDKYHAAAFNDAAFIAAARDAVPMLLDEVARLNGIIKVASDFSVAEVARAEKAEALLRDLVAQIDHEGNADHRLGAFRLGLVMQMIRDHLAEKGDPA